MTRWTLGGRKTTGTVEWEVYWMWVCGKGGKQGESEKKGMLES